LIVRKLKNVKGEEILFTRLFDSLLGYLRREYYFPFSAVAYRAVELWLRASLEEAANLK